MKTLKRNIFYLYIVLLGSLSLWLPSCKKDKYPPYVTFVDGYIRDAVTHESVAGAEVLLWEDDQGGSAEPRDYDRILATTTTDSNGYYRINFKCDPLKTKAIVAKKPLYYYSDHISMSMVSCGRTNIGYNLRPLSWIRIHIKNTNPVNANDSIYIFPNIHLKGSDIDTLFFREIETRNTQLDIWDVTKNGQTIRNFAYTSCSPHDTCDLNIFY